jgi:hypothetical protein
MLPADPLPDLHRPPGRRLDALSVVLVRRERRTDLKAALHRAHVAAQAVAVEHEVIVLDRAGDPAATHSGARIAEPEAGQADVPAAASVARMEWLVLAEIGRAAALTGLGRCLIAVPDHPIVLGRRVGAPALRMPPRRWSHPPALLSRSTRRRVPARTEEFPFVLMRRDLARRLGVVAGSHLPAADLAVLAVLLDSRAAIVRVHDRPACRPHAAHGAPRSGTGAGGPPEV